MTISSSTTRNVHNGNGATTTFAYNFKIYANTQLLVYVDDVLKTLTTHYTVTGVGTSGGNVVFGTAPPSGTSNVVILRNVPLTQETDYVENDPFPAATHEDALDKLTMIAQQLNEKIGRSALVTPSSILTDLVLPTPEAGTAIIWNATEDGFENSDVIADIVSDVAADAAAAAASASAASTSASNASTSASNASTSATNAAASATAAAATVEAGGTIKYTFDSSTTMADPGVGDFRLNNATISSVTAIALSAQAASSGNPDMSDWIITWDDSTNPVKGTLLLREAGANTFATFSVSSVTDNSTWLELAVTHVASGGSLSAADVVFIGFSRAGDAGTAVISDGDKGDVVVSGSGATWVLDNGVINNLTTVTIASNDLLAIADASDSGNKKKALVSDIVTLAQAAGPAFSAYLTSDQTVTTGTFTKCQLNAEHFDTASCFDSSTNYRFTPNVAGYYQINAVMSHYAAAANVTDGAIMVKFNGVDVGRGGRQVYATGTTELRTTFSDVMYFNGSTDYLELWGYTTSASTPTFGGTGSTGGTFLSGILIARA